MTNEKDREIAGIIRSECFVDISQTERPCFEWDLDIAANVIAKYRAEAVQTKEAEIAAILLDPAAVYSNYLRGTINASEIIKAEVTHRVAEAVKAERERCLADDENRFTDAHGTIVHPIFLDD